MTYKVYKSKSAAVAAIKKQGLQNVPHHIHNVDRVGLSRIPGFEPHFKPALPEDVTEIRSRGFRADLDRAAYADHIRVESERRGHQRF